MFFGLIAVDNHPCCKMQEIVEAFFLGAIETQEFSMELFPEWIRATLQNANCALGEKFLNAHRLLHKAGLDAVTRRAIYEQVQLTNGIEELCNGTAHLPESAINWKTELGKAISSLMSALYSSLDLAVFRKDGEAGRPTHQLYSEFIKKNKYVCPFCGLSQFKNKRGARREDFDHYLHKSEYPLAAANCKNLIPTCGICNQDYKKTKDILADGTAFYPYADIPKVKLEVDCNAYPTMNNFDDPGDWSVNLTLIEPDEAAIPKMNAWNRVYAIKKRLEDEIREFFESWMEEVTDDHAFEIEEREFVRLITGARVRAREGAERRVEPKQIIKEAFYDFILNRADKAFRESFRILQNRRYKAAVIDGI